MTDSSPPGGSGNGDDGDHALPPRTPGTDRLLLDAMLGKLATYLRMCGYDAAYALDRGLEADDRLLAVAGAEDRVLVTRDAGLADRDDGAVLLAARDVREQLRELRAAGFRIGLDGAPTRCGSCNGRVEPVAPDEPTPDYAPAPDREDVWRCRDCGQHFWRGSHWDDVAATLAEL